jgi:hypothetical protein
MLLERKKREGSPLSLLERKKLNFKRESIISMFGSFLPSLGFGLTSTKSTQVAGADIVM